VTHVDAATNSKTRTRRLLYLAAVLAVVSLAAGLRLFAAAHLAVDYDEPVYLRDAVDYAGFMRTGDFKMLAWSEATYEHPALYKILYGVVLLGHRPLDRLPDKDLPRLAPIASAAAGPWNIAARHLSVLWGTLAVLGVALVNPLAGLFLGIDTLSVKYTSEVYLEALPLLTSLLCVLAYARWFRLASVSHVQVRDTWIWLLLSAVLLGMTAAGKYVYSIVGVVILLHSLLAMFRGRLSHRSIAHLAAWAILSVLMFVAFDPYLWPHPLARLSQSVLFHEQFQDSRLVLQYHYPWWQPLRWLSAFSSYYDLGPRSAFLINADTLIFALALIGLPRLFLRQPIFFYWLVVGLAFLLAWTTKWPQYTLIILAPFSMSAAEGLLTLWELARRLAGRSPQAGGSPMGGH
jgi:hypothetical protein